MNTELDMILKAHVTRWQKHGIPISHDIRRVMHERCLELETNQNDKPHAKEKKKMHKKLKLDGHVAHRLYNPDGCYTMYVYTVDPTHGLVRVWLNGCVRDWTNERESSYMSILDVKIVPRMLGRHGYLQDVIRAIKDEIFNSTTKEEKKMGEIRKDRFILCGDEDCYLEITPASNKVIFHFGAETQTIQIPDTYDLQWSVDDEKKSCDLKTVKKKPKLLNMKFTVKARPIFRQKYLRSYSDHEMLADNLSWGARPEHYEGDLLHLVIKDGVISTLSSDEELTDWIDYAVYTVDDIPLIESKIREAYNNRKIFPNATSGILITKEEP